MNTPGYHRYMRGSWFIFGMFFGLAWSDWYLLALAVVLVASRAVVDIWREERAGITRDTE